MPLEEGWKWIDGDEWRIDFLGRWSCHGVDEHGWLYTDSDWHNPAPYPFGHPGQPVLPSAEKTSALDSDDEGEEALSVDGFDAGSSDASLPRDVTLATSKTRAETRRRRWLRRAVRVLPPTPS